MQNKSIKKKVVDEFIEKNKVIGKSRFAPDLFPYLASKESSSE